VRAVVGAGLAYGVCETVVKAAALFSQRPFSCRPLMMDGLGSVRVAWVEV